MRKLLFKLARSSVSQFFIGFAFAHLTRLMPLKRKYEDALCILFLHPAPFWEVHWLGVPKRSIRSFAAADLTGLDGDWVLAVFRQLVTVGTAAGIRPKTLLVNGGHYQDVPQIHFHLASGNDNNDNPSGQDQFAPPVDDAVSSGKVAHYAHPVPRRELHRLFTIEACPPLHTLSWTETETAQVRDLLQTIQQFVAKHEPSAYTVVFNFDDAPQLCAHLVGGAALDAA